MSVEWRPVVGWERFYEVSSEGQVRSLRADRVMRPSVAKSGHLRLKLHGSGKSAYVLVHRLVLEAFVGPCPEGMLTCHGDGNPANNRVDNLRWDTPKSNAQDTVRHGRNFFSNKTHCKHGHEFTQANTWINPKSGHRQCRTCFARRTREHNARLKAAAATPGWVAS